MKPNKNEYKKEYSLKEQGFYHSKAWRRLRLLALQRDHYLCQMCLQKGRITKATEVHHVEPVAVCPARALDLSNLMSLCWDCHELTKPRGNERSLPPVRVIRVGNGNGET